MTVKPADLTRASLARLLASTTLVFIAGVHVNWARGSAWPAKTRAELAEAVIGRERLPGRVPTLIVAGALALGARLVASRSDCKSSLQRTGTATVIAVLAARAVAGFAGYLPYGRQSEVFRCWDRRLYSPLCLGLAILSTAGRFGARG